MYLPHLQPIPGLVDLIGEARRRSIPLALASSAPLASVETVLNGLGFRQPPVFASILTERDVRRGKPDPQVYQDSMLRLGVAPERCVVFEDALVGVAAARAAGACCIGLATTYAPELLLEQGAAMVIRNYTDPRLMEWLGWG
jgi:HAD superfamily hydrolase (TIGR01509 family)